MDISETNILFNVEQLNNNYLRQEPLRKDSNKVSKIVGTIKSSYKIISIFDWLFVYDFKKFLINDFISGLTVGIMHIPQGIFFTKLLYLSFIRI